MFKQNLTVSVNDSHKQTLCPPVEMCEVLPTIVDDEGDEDGSKLEQLMISMLEERDKLMDGLKESQESYKEATKQLADVEADNKTLMRQLQALMPEASVRGGVAIIVHVGGVHFRAAQWLPS